MIFERDPYRILAAHEEWCRAGQPRWKKPRVLADADLRGADLSNQTLVHLRLVRVDLREANLSGVILSLAKLEDVLLDGARMTGSHWHLAELERVSLARADLTRANLSSGTFRQVQAQGAILHEADLVKSSWYDSDLTQADFTGSNAIRAELSNCRLTGSNWTRTRHVKSMFDGCDMRDVCLAESTLERVFVTSSRVAGIHGPVAALQGLSARDLDDGTPGGELVPVSEGTLLARLRARDAS